MDLGLWSSGKGNGSGLARPHIEMVCFFGYHYYKPISHPQAKLVLIAKPPVVIKHTALNKWPSEAHLVPRYILCSNCGCSCN